jgi:hypothetical protein
VGLKQDIVGAEAYIAKANRRIGKQRHLMGRSRNRQTVATARDLIEVLTALLANVERQQGRRRHEAEAATKETSH